VPRSEGSSEPPSMRLRRGELAHDPVRAPNRLMGGVGCGGSRLGCSSHRSKSVICTAGWSVTRSSSPASRGPSGRTQIGSESEPAGPSPGIARPPPCPRDRPARRSRSDRGARGCGRHSQRAWHRTPALAHRVSNNDADGSSRSGGGPTRVRSWDRVRDATVPEERPRARTPPRRCSTRTTPHRAHRTG